MMKENAIFHNVPGPPVVFDDKNFGVVTIDSMKETCPKETARQKESIRKFIKKENKETLSMIEIIKKLREALDELEIEL